MNSIFSPQQIILVTCKGKEKIGISRETSEDIVTVAWHMPVATKPLVYAISLAKTLYSTQLIRDSKLFAVNFIPYELQNHAIFCGKYSGKDVDKFSSTGLTKSSCKKIDCPRISQALSYLECNVAYEMELGDHILFIAKVVHSQEIGNGKRLLHAGQNFTTTLH